MRLLFDIETNGFLDQVTVVHTIVTKDLDTGEVTRYADQSNYLSIKEGLAALNQATLLVGHNVMAFDLPVLKKLYNFMPVGIVRDTLLLSRLAWPDIAVNDSHLGDEFPTSQVGKHSLLSWGFRLGLLKGNYGSQPDAWDHWTPEMQEYCVRDVEVNYRLWQKIEAKHLSDISVWLEHRFHAIMLMQTAFGFPFDKAGAEKLTQHLVGRRAELMPQILAAFPPTMEVMKTPEYWTGVVDNNGWQSLAKFPTKGEAQEAKATKIERGPNRKKVIPFNPSSRDEIVARLLERGWQPTRFTDTGKPKADDAALEEALDLLHQPEITLLREYLMVGKRISQIAEGSQAWLKLVGDDGRMHGEVISTGTVTGRCSHINPNMAQVPALKSRTGRDQPYGKECRALFHGPNGWPLIGADASGLELRALAHFMAPYDGGEYVKVVTTGDVHTLNQQAAGLDSRPKAKTFIYAYIYGASDWKLGFTAELQPGEAERLKAEEPDRWAQARRGIIQANKRRKVTKTLDDETIAYTVKGSILREQFETKLPAMKKLRDAMIRKITELTPRGYRRLKKDAEIRGIDGRIVPIRSKHSALNTLLQGAGGLLVKTATIFLYDMALERGWVWGKDFAFVAHIHDEMQMVSRPEIADELGQMFSTALQKAGEFYHFRCPLKGEYKVGQDWSVTH